ncbi:hypothetical protein WAJ00_20335, partial [Acinetobacter baumannii]
GKSYSNENFEPITFAQRQPAAAGFLNRQRGCQAMTIHHNGLSLTPSFHHRPRETLILAGLKERYAAFEKSGFGQFVYPT